MQIPKTFLQKQKKKNPEIRMEIQGTPNTQGSLVKEQNLST